MRRGALAAPLVAAGLAHAHGPAPSEPAFEPPPVGSYTLAPIQRGPEGSVLDSHGRTQRLADLTRGRITLLGLVYTRCRDPEGCPLASWALSATRARLRADPALEARVRFLTLSFDPAHDRPAVMARYARQAGAGRPGAEWRFLTTRSRQELRPILEALGQDLRVAVGPAAGPGTTEFSHTLKVFLLDPAGDVREIYASAYLHPAMIVNDIRTLAAEER